MKTLNIFGDYQKALTLVSVVIGVSLLVADFIKTP